MKLLQPNDLGKTFLVEDCQKIVISEFLKKYRVQLKELVVKSELEILDISVGLTTSRAGFKGVRFWFKCPLCAKRIGVLFKHPLGNRIGCRVCLKLEYRKRRYRGMLEEKLALRRITTA